MKSIKIFLFMVTSLLLVVSLVSASGTEERSVEEKITFTIMASGTYDEAARTIKDDFKAETGIDVTIAAFPWATLRQNNTTDLLTGSGQYDIMSGSYYLADVYDHFISLDGYIEKYGFGQGLLPGLMKKCEFYNGSQIGLPYGIDAYGLLYRKDLFDQAGLKWPETWEQFVQMLPDLHKLAQENGIDTLLFAGGAPEQLPALFFDKYDGYMISKENKYKLEKDKAVKALEMNNLLKKYMAKDFLGLNIDDANARFLGGDGLILICWPSFVVAAADNPDKSNIVGKWELGTAFTPGRPWLSLWQLYISKYSKNPEAAFQWANYFLAEQFDKQYFTNYGISPIYESTYNDPQLIKDHEHQFEAQVINISRAFNPPLSGEAQDYFASMLADFFLGTYTPADLVEIVNRQWADFPIPKALVEVAEITGQKE